MTDLQISYVLFVLVGVIGVLVVLARRQAERMINRRMGFMRRSPTPAGTPRPAP